MEESHLETARSRLCNATFLNFVTLCMVPILIAAGCAAPGEPIAKQPAVALEINDLAAKQIGSSVVLTFTAPKKTVQGDPLPRPPEIEIYREFLAAQPAGVENPSQPETPNQLVLTVTPEMEAQCREGNRLNIPAPLAATDIVSHAGESAVFMVRTKISKRDSVDSNLAEALILPPPPQVENLHAQVTKSAIGLSWTGIQVPSGSTLKPSSIRYRVYRMQGAVPASPSSPAEGTGSNARGPAFALLGEIASPSFSDANFTFGQTYAYAVRSVARYDAGEVESEDSAPLIVTPRDTFPPAAPTGLVAAPVPAREGEPPHVDLSWEISPETSVTGYNVYRSEEESSIGNRVNSQPVPAPTFRDSSIVAGRRYFYRVTAVDSSGNESAPSATIAVTLPGASEQEIGAGTSRHVQ